jgi:23S rRNA pseudouridine955/2504/2580 synthase
MQERVIEEKEAGQRLNKFLHKYLPEAGAGFLYKMLRKKNITLNGRKAAGDEHLVAGDRITLFLSPETLSKFMGRPQSLDNYSEAYHSLSPIKILYENDHILIVDKPSGILSQKAAPTDRSLNEWLIGYLIDQDKITAAELATYKPSICNRLDRNTSGIVLCAKTLAGSQIMSRLLKERTVHKYYQLYVGGRITTAGTIKGDLHKDEVKNKVTILPEGDRIITHYRPLQLWSDRTLLEVQLVTGKTHQIRAHLASIGHPLIGDHKYGDRQLNDLYKKRYQVADQLLHACRIEFPELTGQLADLSDKVIVCEPPDLFRQMM